METPVTDQTPAEGTTTTGTTAEGTPVLITTQHRGVFFGYAEPGADLHARTLTLTGARMAIRFGTTGGVAQLAETGPTRQSKIGTRTDLPVVLHDVTAVWTVAPAAAEAWEKA